MFLRRAGRVAVAIAAYWLVFFALDQGATLFEVVPGVSPWYPSAGLNLAFLLLLGPRLAPAVFLASLGSGLLISNPPIPLQHLLLPNLIIAAAHAGAAAWMRSLFSVRDVFSVRAALVFAAFALLLPAVVSVLCVSSYAWTGLYPASMDAFTEAAFGWWVGDVVGILTVTPLLLIAALSALPLDDVPESERDLFQFRISNARGLLVFAGDTLLLVGALYMAFYSAFTDSFQFHFCFPPLLWIALRHGLPRAVVASAFVNLGAAMALRHRGAVDQVLEFQLFMMALALTALFLGVVISERQRAVRALKRAGSHLHERLSGFDLPQKHSVQLSTLFPHPSIDVDALEDSAVSGLQQTDVFYDSEDVLRKSTDNLIALNEHLLRSERRLSDLNEQKDRFLSIISHDLKNPLVGIRGLAEMLMRRMDDEETRPLRLMQRSAQQALDLLENLLTWARLETGHFSFDPTDMQLHALVSDSIDLLEGAAEKKDIVLENEVDDDLYVRADEVAVDTVLRNLISNAIKFTNPGGFVSVAAEVDEDVVTVAVVDSGVGIKPERVDMLFRFEERTSTGGTAGESGTGLGLHLCRELLERHGHRIWVESEVDVGTTFYFTLPRASAPASSRPSMASAASSNY